MTDTVSRQTPDNETLPDSWEWTKLSEIGTVASGGTPKTKDPSNFDGDVPWITPADLSGYTDKTIAHGRRNISQRGLDSSSARLLPEGTVIFSSRAPVGYAVIAGNPISTNQGCKNLIPSDGVFNEYVFYYLKGSKSLAESYASGTTFLELSAKAFGRLPIPLPPLNEQRRIVEKIEELFTKLDAGIRSLKQTQALLETYRRSGLKAAVEGELSREWREAHKDELEPASELLERVLRNRREKWEAGEISKMEAKGRSPKDDRWKKRYKEPALPEISELPYLPEIPTEWIWVSLGQLTWSVKDGPHYSPSYVKEGIPFITGGNVRPHGVDFNGAKRITPELHVELLQRCKPEKYDILYTKGGTTGIARVNTYDTKFSVWVHVAVLKLADIDSVEPFYMQHALNSPLCYAQSQKYTHGVGNQDLGLTRMVRICLPLPPIEEQQWIRAEIERRLSVVDKLETTVEANLKQAGGLRQSILVQAFSGQLVSQDPDDEPASVLLERIRAERQSAKPKARKERKSNARPTNSDHAEQRGLF